MPNVNKSPGADQIAFVSSANMQPSWHYPNTSYSAAGYIPHPLQITGHMPMLPTHADAPPQAPSGATVTRGAIADLLTTAPHPYTVNGREPGGFDNIGLPIPSYAAFRS
jgi:hypothetical protein